MSKCYSSRKKEQIWIAEVFHCYEDSRNIWLRFNARVTAVEKKFQTQILQTRFLFFVDCWKSLQQPDFSTVFLFGLNQYTVQSFLQCYNFRTVLLFSIVTDVFHWDEKKTHFFCSSVSTIVLLDMESKLSSKPSLTAWELLHRDKLLKQSACKVKFRFLKSSTSLTIYSPSLKLEIIHSFIVVPFTVKSWDLLWQGMCAKSTSIYILLYLYEVYCEIYNYVK